MEEAIVNPLTGERIWIRTRGAETGGALMVWDLELAPGGHVPISHSHPEQEEAFHVVSGQMRFRVGWRRITAGPGESVVVPPGTVHHFSNHGTVPACVHVESRPALNMEEMLAVGAALARDQYAAGRKLPHLGELALFLTDFEREAQSAILPGVVRALCRPVAQLLRRRARHYRDVVAAHTGGRSLTG